MNIGTLSLAQTPHLAVPLRFFLTAPLFAMAGGLLLATTGGHLLASRWLLQSIALTHLFTLGFVAMVMFGAVQQVLSVLAGSPMPRPQALSRLLHITLTIGTLLLATGLWCSAPRLLLAALPLLAVAALVFCAGAFYSLLYARSAHATVRATAMAVTAFLFTALLGLRLAAGHALQVGHASPTVHRRPPRLGAAGMGRIADGWSGLPSGADVSGHSRVPPIDDPLARSRGIRWPALVGRRPRVAFEWTGLGRRALFIAVGYVWFGVTTLRLQQLRRRRLPDVTVDYWRLAMISLLLAVAAWLISHLLPEAAAQLQRTVAVLLVIGFAMGAISGMLYKIVPFLVWLHLNKRAQERGRQQRGIPNMKQIIDERPMRR